MYHSKVAKTVEGAAVSQIQKYVSEYHLQAKTQSAYRPSHSCETALLRVSSDILMSLDKGQEVILILLDYSSAFDTISHDTIHAEAATVVWNPRSCT